MPVLHFTANIQRHVTCPKQAVNGTTVRACLEEYFNTQPTARSYVLDDQGALRKHMNIFVNTEQIHDRQRLSDAVGVDDEVFVIQALSGGA